MKLNKRYEQIKLDGGSKTKVEKYQTALRLLAILSGETVGVLTNFREGSRWCGQHSHIAGSQVES